MPDFRRMAEVCRYRARQATVRRQQLQRAALHGGELARQAIRHLPGDRHAALAFELLDRGPGLGPDGAGRLDVAIAEVGDFGGAAALTALSRIPPPHGVREHSSNDIGRSRSAAPSGGEYCPNVTTEWSRSAVDWAFPGSRQCRRT